MRHSVPCTMSCISYSTVVFDRGLEVLIGQGEWRMVMAQQLRDRAESGS